jgi:hypothetical protein
MEHRYRSAIALLLLLVSMTIGWRTPRWWIEELENAAGENLPNAEIVKNEKAWRRMVKLIYQEQDACTALKNATDDLRNQGPLFTAPLPCLDNGQVNDSHNFETWTRSDMFQKLGDFFRSLDLLPEELQGKRGSYDDDDKAKLRTMFYFLCQKCRVTLSTLSRKRLALRLYTMVTADGRPEAPMMAGPPQVPHNAALSVLGTE